MNDHPDRPSHPAPAEQELRHALRRLRGRSGDKTPRPLDLRPTTPFEQAILHQYQELRRDYEELKKRVDWLTLAILGAALTMVLERIFLTPP